VTEPRRETRRSPAARRAAASRPHGKEQVVAAILNAAELEVLEHGPVATTTRAIAERAGVNHALLFRHFGTKADLLTAVQRRHTQRFWNRITELDVPLEQLFVEFAADADFWKLMARSSLDGTLVVPAPGQPVPGIELLIERVTRAQREGLLPDDVEPERILFLQFALVLGLVVLDPALTSVFPVPATGRPRSEEMLRTWFEIARPEVRPDAPPRARRRS
jgi:AcrR family transcriptional regulator